MLLLSDNGADVTGVTVDGSAGVANRSRSRGRGRRRALPIGLAIALLVATAACSYTADLSKLTSAVPDQSSVVLAADGSVLARLDAGIHRTDVPLSKVSPNLQHAVIAIEDHRFYEHPGVDVHAMLRALRTDIDKGEIAQGGSTITQQYVRNVMLNDQKTVHRKLREVTLAVQLERKFTKHQILEHYLNLVYFGSGSYGVQSAAERYFGVPASNLTLTQGALIAGLIQAPEGYNPFVVPQAALTRRNVVLDKMAEYGYATKAVVAKAKTEPLGLHPQPADDEMRAPYFVAEVEQFVLSHKQFGATIDARRHLLYTGGLVIRTTLDPARQQEAESALNHVLVDPAQDPSGALVSIDPRNGHVEAYVGGRDFYGSEPYAQFDLAGQGQRQAGSAFKPFVLAAALEDDVPLTRTYAAPKTLTITSPGQEPWVLHNYDGTGGGHMNLVDATVHSVNTVYAQLIEDIGPQRVVDLASHVGIRSPLTPYLSTAIGSNAVTVLDMASAYTSFAADGIHNDPVFVTSVVAPNGNVLYRSQTDSQRVLPTSIAREVNGVMQQVVTRGTGINARIGRPVAGKTGTGENWKDAWFVGSTPQLTTAVWVGYPQKELSMVPPRTREKVTGGTWPAQIWGLYEGAALAEVPIAQFPTPDVGTVTTEPPSPPVADVVGMPFNQAQQVLTDTGYRVTRVDVASRQYPPGVVVAQDPVGHTASTRGALVTLKVANGPPQTVTVPTVLGLLGDQASATIGAHLLHARIIVQAAPPPNPASLAGRVWKQSPVGNSEVDAYGTVTIWVNPS
jgi:penicillin-binding protein 1A